MVQRNKTQKLNKKTKTSFPSRIYLYSTPKTAQRMAYKYLGKTAKLYPASNPNKKYKIFDPKNNTWVNFGQMGYEDYTKHNDKDRRERYLKRALKIKGNWQNNPFSPNNLSINLLW